jgi:hypothetical protein
MSSLARSAVVTSLVLSCGGGSTIPVDQIPADKKLVDVSSDEQSSLCSWLRSTAATKLPPSGTKVSCGGVSVPVNWSVDCMFSSHLPPTCTATVAQARACYPAFFDRAATNLCRLATLTGPSDLEDFISDIPACSWFRGCVYVLPGQAAAARVRGTLTIPALDLR